MEATLAELAPAPASVGQLDALAGGEPLLAIDDLVAGYGAMQVLHGVSLRLARGQSLCLIGPNGAGKSTVLHSIFGLTDIASGRITVNGTDLTRLAPSRRLQHSGIAYVLQDNSVFPDMTVEENLWMGGWLLPDAGQARERAERVFEKYASLRERRSQRAAVLSGGERRLLEISRALMMQPQLLLVDEPSIGLEPRFVDMVFDILRDLQRVDGKTIVMVEQNATKGLEFADVGYVLVAGRVVLADKGSALLDNPQVGRMFLGA
jgi:branched-chain amino acid transport system ATP-binding protein